MTEEEKEAIKDLIDSSYESLLDGTTITSNKAINTILNLIEKLQKENEELKEKNDINIAYAEYLEKILNEYKKESVSKQKVKDKIEKLIDRYESFNIESKISILKELLGDK